MGLALAINSLFALFCMGIHYFYLKVLVNFFLLLGHLRYFTEQSWVYAHLDKDFLRILFNFLTAQLELTLKLLF
jgi:hypothetical protein